MLQAPDAQVPTLQALASQQAAVLLVNLQPVLGSQASVVQGLPSSQAKGVPLMQTFVSHLSPTVQALSSLHLLELSW